MGFHIIISINHNFKIRTMTCTQCKQINNIRVIQPACLMKEVPSSSIPTPMTTPKSLSTHSPCDINFGPETERISPNFSIITILLWVIIRS